MHALASRDGFTPLTELSHAQDATDDASDAASSTVSRETLLLESDGLHRPAVGESESPQRSSSLSYVQPITAGRRRSSTRRSSSRPVLTRGLTMLDIGKTTIDMSELQASGSSDYSDSDGSSSGSADAGAGMQDEPVKAPVPVPGSGGRKMPALTSGTAATMVRGPLREFERRSSCCSYNAQHCCKQNIPVICSIHLRCSCRAVHSLGLIGMVRARNVLFRTQQKALALRASWNQADRCHPCAMWSTRI
jgi:hypothetical protein